MSDPVRVLVVDDQALVREGLMTLLTTVAGISPVAAASDGEEAIAAAQRHRPDVVLMDLRMPRIGGVEATRRIRQALPDTEVVVLTTHADVASTGDALRAGAVSHRWQALSFAPIWPMLAGAGEHDVCS